MRAPKVTASARARKENIETKYHHLHSMGVAGSSPAAPTKAMTNAAPVSHTCGVPIFCLRALTRLQAMDGIEPGRILATAIISLWLACLAFDRREVPYGPE